MYYLRILDLIGTKLLIVIVAKTVPEVECYTVQEVEHWTYNPEAEEVQAPQAT